MESFYITLPSNTDNPSFKNKANNYKTHLPTELDLKGKWECGLSEITFDKRWKTIDQDTHVWLRYDTELPTGEPKKVNMNLDIPSGYYAKPQDYFKKVLEVFHLTGRIITPLNDLADTLTVEYDESTGEMMFIMDGDYEFDLVFDHRVEKMLRLPSKVFKLEPPKTVISWYPPQEMQSTSCLYVYCDVIEDNIVGNVRAKLLRTVSIAGHLQSRINHIYTSPYYHPVRPGYISDIEIKICDGEGDVIRFGKANTILVLHFRRLASI